MGLDNLRNLKKELKEGGKGIGDKIDRGDDVSNFFAKAFVKSDILNAIEAQGGYMIRDNLGNPIIINPKGGISGSAGAVNPSELLNQLEGRPAGSAPGKLAKSMSAGESFRALGEKSEAEQAQDDKEKEFLDFVQTMSKLEVQMLDAVSKDRMLVPIEKISRLRKQGKETGFERLIDHGLISWQKADGMAEFRITGLGRKVLSALHE